ncbi:TonB-dependent receptor [Steroidobacter sp.]|uniref:TonB-dependent receptor n=1 Tax=Steroidobacter sp. TaxID=1978227 RepID=UPI001A422E18|nr:TonB-dependent receptor [Steroidobacter sp.]MBL8269276.1 TonB-dependent receptor [Steroidobacter sp.]
MLVRATPPLIALIVGACLSGRATAQQSSAAADSAQVDMASVEEVIVTARKRSEREIDVPQSLNVFSGAALEATGVSSFEQLQYRIPGVAAVSGPGNQIAIRGISNNASQRGGGPSTAVHLDGVYLPRPELALGEVFDLGRVEVLKGPEGTLYGRNATAGVVNYISRDPGEEMGFDGFIGAGSNSMLRGQAGATIVAGDHARFRISGAKHQDDGYTHNLHAAGGTIDGRDYQAARLRGVFDISPAVTATLTGQIVDDTGTLGYGVSGNPEALNYVNFLEPPQRRDQRHIQIDTPPEVRRRGGIGAAQINARLANDLELKSITGYVHYTSRNRYDADGSGGFIENTEGSDKSEFWSQEFQLSGNAGDNVSWTSGLYFSREQTSGGTLVLDSNFYPVDLTPFIYSVTEFSAESHSEAVFGELTYGFLENWSIVGGARYTRERIKGSSSGGDIDFDTFELVPFSGAESESSSRFTPKVSLQYKPSRNATLYASATTGFKSGGINFNPPVKTYRPEKVRAYEVGAKTLLLNGGLELTAAAFHYDYRDLQLRTVVGNQAPISNVAKATIQGVEFGMLTAPLAGLTVDLNAAYTDSELEEYFSPATGTDLSGMPLPLAPEFSGTLGTQYQANVGGFSLTARAEVNRQGSLIFPALQAPAIERRGAVTLVNANLQLGLRDGRTYISLLGRNLTDQTYLSNRSYSAGFADIETYAAPRTYEVRIGTAF